MTRLLLYLVLGYVLWKILQIVSRGISGSHRSQGDVFGDRPAQKPPKDFKDVQDAEFEELPPDDKK